MDDITKEMLCNNGHVNLSDADIKQALQLQGELFFLKLTYNDIDEELGAKKLNDKFLESLSILISFEDDGTKEDEIKKFIRHIYENTHEEQHLQFGIKSVKYLSPYPVKILFSGILPINQLEIAVGGELYSYVEQHREELKESFKNFRRSISHEVNMPILPVKHYKNTKLKPYGIELIDTPTQESICKCNIPNDILDAKEIIKLYLFKLYKVYINLCYEQKKDL